jgi:heat shock protein HtpX
MTNALKTTLLLGLLTGLILWIGNYLGGSQGLVIAFVFAAVMNFGSYWFSDKLVLAMYRARPVGMNEAPDLYRIVQNLATRAQMPMPKLYVIPSEAANAFATGRNPQHAAVAVTEGIMRLMSWEELEGVLAHEISHVRNRDILISSIAATIATAITFVARMAIFFPGGRDSEGRSPYAALLMLFLAPFAALLIQMAISRTREFGADATAAKYTGSPEGLASALRKLEAWSKRIPMDASPAHEHMFIIKPFSGQAFMKLFSTHPPTAERISRLQQLRFAGL